MATDTKTRVPGERRIDDAGIKIGGARKDFHARAMTLDDIDAMTPAEQAQLVTKDHVWPVPDYAAMVEAGTPAMVAAQIKVMRDRVAAKPNAGRDSTPEQAARNYIRMLSVSKEVIESCRSMAELKGAEDRIFAAIGYSSYDRASNMLAYSVATNRSLPFNVGWKDAVKVETLLTGGFPGEIPTWKRGVKVRQYHSSTVGTYFSLIKGGKYVVKTAPSEEAAWAELKAAHDLAQETKKNNPEALKAQNPDHPHLAHLKRKGPETGNDLAISSNAFIETFGFRGVEFGLWLPDNERQEVLNLGFDAFHDLAWVLDIHPSQLGLYNTMSMAFGARGKGNAAAHYEPGRKVINATKLSGAGKVAHEFGHALDHWLGMQGHDSEVENGYARYASGGRSTLPERTLSRSAALYKLDPAFVKSLNALLNAIIWRPITQEEWIAERSKKVASAREKAAKGEKALDSMRAKPDYKEDTRKESVETTYVASVEYWTHAADNIDRVIEEEKASPKGDYGSTNTDYLLQARALCGPSGEYWTRPTELLARSFEAFAFDKLQAAGRRSDYLVHSVEPNRYGQPRYRGNPYPAGEERTRINAAYHDLVGLLNKMLPTPEHFLREALAAQPQEAWTPTDEVDEPTAPESVFEEPAPLTATRDTEPVLAAETPSDTDLTDEQLLQALLGDGMSADAIAVAVPVPQPVAQPVVLPVAQAPATPAAKLRARAAVTPPKPNAKQISFSW